jgi:hypothetical protein
VAKNTPINTFDALYFVANAITKSCVLSPIFARTTHLLQLGMQLNLNAFHRPFLGYSIKENKKDFKHNPKKGYVKSLVTKAVTKPGDKSPAC